MELQYTSIVEPVVTRAQSEPEQEVLVLLHADGTEEHITAADMLRGTQAYAAALIEAGIQPRQHVVLVMGHTLELFYAFLGAIYIDAIPSIFAYPTPHIDLNLYLGRVHQLIEHYGIEAVIAESDYAPQMRALTADTACRVLNTAEIAHNEAVEVPPFVEPDPEAVAFIQHTSGTTAIPKGVALSHRAVMNNITDLIACFGIEAYKDVAVTWLPLYHDMGLMGAIMLPLSTHMLAVSMSPIEWVRYPRMMFQAVSKFKGTITWMPNFAYNLSAKAVRSKDLEGVDLSTWRYILNGSEPIRAESHEMFLAKFAPYGLRESALKSGYGFAEGVVAVTLAPYDEPLPVDVISHTAMLEQNQAVPTTPDDPDAFHMVSSGVETPGSQVRIAAEDGTLLDERHIGEILVKSHALFEGYYARPDLTAETFTQDGWYRTGDLGYMADGHLYVIGRKKDLIIVAGKNIHPHEIEAMADEIPQFRPGRTVAFGVDDNSQGTERIVIVAELREELPEEAQHELERALRRRVTQGLGVTLGDVRFVGKRWVIKTSSGKVARADNRRKYFKEFHPA